MLVSLIHLCANVKCQSILLMAKFPKYWGDVTFGSAILVLLGFAVVALLSIQPRLRRTLA